MKKYYYDLHTHSALSPCADDESTPANLAGMAAVCGLDIVALTDHNSTKNCPAFFEAAHALGIIPIAGVEFTTSEDIHIVCLFPTLSDAMAFGEETDRHRIKIKNRPEIFGEQLIFDAEDNVIGKEEDLLSVATDVSVEVLPELVKKYNGICYPAHVDRDSNGIIAILGAMPESPVFGAVEFRDRSNVEKYTELYGLSGKCVVVNSDSHYLGTISDRVNYIELDSEREDEEAVVSELLRRLGLE